jgi:hypothetical protein
MRSITTLTRLMLAACALPLASCASSTRSVVSPAAPLVAPEALTRRCAAPANLPMGSLEARRVFRFWARDRLALAVCLDRHAALAAFIDTQAAQAPP